MITSVEDVYNQIKRFGLKGGFKEAAVPCKVDRYARMPLPISLPEHIRPYWPLYVRDLTRTMRLEMRQIEGDQRRQNIPVHTVLVTSRISEEDKSQGVSDCPSIQPVVTDP